MFTSQPLNISCDSISVKFADRPADHKIPKSQQCYTSCIKTVQAFVKHCLSNNKALIQKRTSLGHGQK